ncbi:MAG: hypothetical protein COW08_03265 [Ignavibacteriales bacterium CG12_big_fil_rev_8_21_14_0_65_30_8]|nr:MAG: hypothetical protein COW08_03265 [Ignavibacteriales bacterium CG12_big_fil_rev_8_21_14_0_65_30_8]
MTQSKNNLINKAINEIESIVNRYTDLEILYTVSTKDDIPDNSYSYVSEFVDVKKNNTIATCGSNNTNRRMTVVNSEKKQVFGKIENNKLWL